MRLELVKDRWVVVFESVHEQVSMSCHARQKREHEYPQSARVTKYSFVGRRFKDIHQVEKEAQEHWAEGAFMVEDAMRQLEDVELPNPMSFQRRQQWTEEAGDDFNYERFQAGLDAFRVSRRETRKGPAVFTIAINVSTAWFIEPASIVWRGVAGICLAQILERAGFRTEIFAMNKTKRAFRSSKSFLIGCCLKRAGDPLDVSALINAVSGWYYRTIMFSSWSMVENERPAETLGTPQLIVPEDVELISPGALSTEGMVVQNCWSKKQAIEAVRDALSAMNGVRS